MRSRLALLFVFLVSAAPSGGRQSPAADGSAPSRTSPIAVSADGSLVATANPDSNSISILAITTRELTEIQVGRNPQSLSLGSDGSVWVVSRDDDTVSQVSLTERSLIRTIPVCREPFGVIAAGEELLVSCGGESSVAAIDLRGLRPTRMISTEADPRGLAHWPDRTKLLVTHFTTGKLSVIDIASKTVETVITTLADSNLSQSVFIDAATQLAYLPQSRSNSSNPALLFDTTIFPIVSVIDLRSRTNLNARRIAIDIADRPSGIPIDAVVTSAKLYVVHAASNDLSVIDLATGFARAHLEVGDHPRGLALSPDGKRLYVNNTLSGSVTVIDTEADRVLETIEVTRIPLPPNILNGKRLFNSSASPRLARDRWISCASCHFDGGADGHTWFFRDGPRNTPSLLGVGKTLPLHWSGDLDELQDVEDTIRVRQGGSGLTDGTSNCDPACNQGSPNAGRSTDLDDLAAFMRSLRIRSAPPPLSAEAQRGQRIFFSSADCSVCHLPPLFIDRQKHDVGTGTGPLEWKGTAFDTPSLRGLERTAPYLHDGSAPTLMDVLTTANRADRHGKTSHLTPAELEDLVSFLLSIPTTVTRARPVRR